MQRAMELALKGIGYVSPNPLVGCVIVHDDKIIGEGYHQKYGQAHAEVNAIDAVTDKSLLRDSTLYVNLEPCSHFGKTPPCADLLIRHNVKKVVIANVDSNPLVGGRGITKLREAGVEVVTNVLEQEGREVNKRFFTFVEKQRPYIVLKWAQTSDGFIARKNFDSKWISSELSRQLVHRWRSEEAAILVGKNTALHDDPQLNVRSWTGPNPVRIVIDRNLSLPKHLKMFTDNQPTLVYNVKESDTNGVIHRIRVSANSFFQDLIVDLYHRGLQSIIIEGGASTLANFINLDLWDEARVFTSHQEFREGIPAPQISGMLMSSEMIDTDFLKIYRRET